MWMGYSDTDARFPGLGTGGAPMAGPRYYFDETNPSPTKSLRNTTASGSSPSGRTTDQDR